MDDKTLERAYHLTLENADLVIKEATILKNVGLFPRSEGFAILLRNLPNN